MELLFHVVDKHEGALGGQLISPQANGSYWSKEERTADGWQIFRVECLQSTVDALTSGWMLDFAKLPAGLLFDRRRQEIITLSRVDFERAVVKR